MRLPIGITFSLYFPPIFKIFLLKIVNICYKIEIVYFRDKILH